MRNKSGEEHGNILFRAFVSGDNSPELAREAVEHYESRIALLESKIQDDYLAEKIALAVAKSNNELYQKFSDEMRVQYKELIDKMNVQYKELSDKMNVQYKELSDKMNVQYKELSDKMNFQYKELSNKTNVQHKEFYSALQRHTYWTVGSIFAAAAIIVTAIALLI